MLAASALVNHQNEQSVTASYALLGAMSILASVLIPHATAFGVRVSNS
jgi:ABC-type transport system involved in cytochrome c biogenesis permease component